jgi:hypothetical protein
MVNNIPAYLQGLETEQPKEESNIPAYLQGISTTTVPEESIITNFDEPSDIKKAQYGAAQETYLLGDIYRLTKAAVTTKTSKELEQERQREIFEQFPEFKDGKYDNDAAVWGGRGLVMVSDPVYLLMPWARAAQAGRAYKGIKKYTAATAATAALGAGVGAGTTAIKKGASGEKVTSTDIAIGAAAGAVLSPIALGVTAGVSKVAGKVAPNLFNKDKVTQEAVKKLLQENQIKGLNLSAKQLADVQKISKLPEVQKLFKELAVQDNNYVNYILPRENVLKVIQKLKEVQGDTKGLKKIYAGLKPKERKLLNLSNIKDLSKLSVQLRNEAKKALEKQATAESKYNLELVKQVHAIGGLKSQVGRALAINFTRPLVGAAMGASAGTLFAETDEGFYGFMASGFVLGSMSRALRSGKVTGIPLLEQKGFAKLLDSNYIKNLGRSLNIRFSTTQSSKLSQRGPVMDEFSNMMFPKFDTSVKLDWTGRIIKGQGAKLTGYSNNIESSAVTSFQKFTGAIYGEGGVIGNSSIEAQADALKIVRGAKGKFSQESQDLAIRIKDFLNSFKTYYNQVGIKEAEVIANYFPRKINFNTVNNSPESKKAFMLDMAKVFQNLTKNASESNPIKVGLKSDGTDAVVTSKLSKAQALQRAEKYFQAQVGTLEKSIINSEKEFVSKKLVLPLSEHINKERVLQGSYDDVEKVIEKWLVNDIGAVLNDLTKKSVQSVEFARKFGPEGQLLRTYFKRLDEQYLKQGGVKKLSDLDANLARKLQSDKEAIINSTNSLFGRFGKNGSPVTKNIVATLSTLANLTMMDKVTIANLGDLVQPFQNSRHFGSWIQGIARTSGRTSKEKGGAEALELYHGQVARQLLKDVYIGGEGAELGGQKSARYIDLIGKSNEKFFKLIGLEGITNLSRRYAFNVGIVDGHKTARAIALKVEASGGKSIKDLKNIDKITVEDLNHLSTLGINNFDDIIKLGSIKNLDDALANSTTKSILNKIGLKSADRDAIIPTVGNRLLFTQSRDPWVRIIGQFSSWAMAKSAQTNALIAKAESGEQAQLFRMTGALAVYGAIYNLREFVKYGEIKTNIDDDAGIWAAHSMNLSGNMGWLPTFVVNKLVGPGSQNPLEFFPGTSIAKNIFQAGLQFPVQTAIGTPGAYDKMMRSFFKALPLPTVRAALSRLGIPGLVYKGDPNFKEDIKQGNESTRMFNQGGYVKELTRRLQQRNN